MYKSDKLKIFSGNANLPLANAIAKAIKIPLGKAMVNKFSDGEIRVRIQENIRGKDCFIVQPTSPSVNENIMELLIIIDAMVRASASHITAVLPYYGYGRQDRKSEPRVPISAKLVANLITAAGADRVLTMDLHAGQIQGFFDIPVDHLYATPVFLDYFKKKNLRNIVVVAPDPGGVERARAFAKRLHADLAIVDKRRPKPNFASVMNVIGDVAHKTAIILDDIVDTGGTLLKVAEALKERKAISVFAACSHGVLSGDAVTRFNESDVVEELIITNSIQFKEKSKKITILSIANLLAEAIKRIHGRESLSELFV